MTGMISKLKQNVSHAVGNAMGRKETTTSSSPEKSKKMPKVSEEYKLVAAAAAAGQDVGGGHTMSDVAGTYNEVVNEKAKDKGASKNNTTSENILKQGTSSLLSSISSLGNNIKDFGKKLGSNDKLNKDVTLHGESEGANDSTINSELQVMDKEKESATETDAGKSISAPKRLTMLARNLSLRGEGPRSLHSSNESISKGGVDNVLGGSSSSPNSTIGRTFSIRDSLKLRKSPSLIPAAPSQPIPEKSSYEQTSTVLQRSQTILNRKRRVISDTVFGSILEPKDASVVKGLFKLKRYNTGHVLMVQDQDAEKIYLVTKGRLKCTTKKGKKLCAKVPGEFINNELFVKALKGKPHISPFKVECNEACELLECPLINYLEFCGRSKSITITPQLALFSRSMLLKSVATMLGVNDTEEEQLFYEMFSYTYLKAEKIVHFDNEDQRELFIVVSGAVAEYKNYNKPNQTNNGQYGPGQYFGEYSLCMDQPMTYTIKTISDTVLLTLKKTRFDKFLKACPTVAEKWAKSFEETVKKTACKTFKRINVPFLKDFTDEQFQQLIKNATIKGYNVDEVVFNENDQATYFYMVVKGSFRVCSSSDENIGEINDSMCFGEIAVVSDDGKRRSTVKAIQPSVLLCLHKEKFAHLFMQIPSMAAHIKAQINPMTMAVHDILNHSQAFAVFRKHLQEEFSEENMKFLDAVNNYALIQSNRVAQLKCAKEIYYQFLEREKNSNQNTHVGDMNSSGANLGLGDLSALSNLGFGGKDMGKSNSRKRESINISTLVIEEIGEKIEQCETKENAEDDDDKDLLSPRLFDSCTEEVLALMSSDTLVRFKNTEVFQAFMESLKGQRNAQ